MKTTPILIGLIIAGGILSGEASAQETSKQKASSQNKTESTSSTRVRRASSSESQSQEAQATETKKEEASQSAASPKEATPSPAVSPTPAEGNKPAAKPGSTPDSKPAEAKPAVAADVDPVTQLREQINAAKDQEKLRLQLKLSDQLVSLGKKSEALQELHSISTSDVFDPTTFYNLGNAFARLGETDAAINSYHKAIEQRKGQYSRAYNNMGVLMLRMGRWDEAYDALLSALKLENFHYAEASYNLGRVYAARGQSDLAVREWQRALKVDPQHEAAALALSRPAVGGERIVVEPKPVSTSSAPRGNSAVAAPLVKPGVEKSSSSTRSASADRQSRTVSIDQTSFDYLQRARNSSDRGNLSDAVNSYRQLISRQGGYFAPANLEMSFALISLKRYDEALDNLQQVTIRDGSRYPISYFHLARVYEAKGDLKQAETAFSQAAASYGSNNAQFLLDLSRVREKQGNYRGALEAMEKYVSQTESDGLKLSWSDERIAALRQKVGTEPR